MMATPLRVVIVEDSNDDTSFLEETFRRNGYSSTMTHVKTTRALDTIVNHKAQDIVITDHVEPTLSGLAALAMLKENELDLHCVILSDDICPETAVEVMHAGAHDYFTKGDFTRLLPAIRQELYGVGVYHDHGQVGETPWRIQSQNERILTSISSILIATNENDQITQ